VLGLALVLTVAVVAHPGPLVAAARTVAAREQARVVVAEPEPEPAPQLRRLAVGGADLVVAPAAPALAPAIARRYHVPFLVAGGTAVPGLVAGLLERPLAAARAAGVDAGRRTSTGILGVIGGADVAAAFAAGAKSVEPLIEVYRGTSATALLAHGADVVLGGGAATRGAVARERARRDVWAYELVPDYEPAIAQAVRDVERGTFGARSYDVTPRLAIVGETRQGEVGQLRRAHGQSPRALKRASQAMP
jgi:hypothetical protein